MTKQDLERYEARLTWVKALDAATEAAQARIQATLASNRKARQRHSGAEGPIVFHRQARTAPEQSTGGAF